MSPPTHSISLDSLREHIRRIEVPRAHAVSPFGIAAIDRALPGGGLPLGALHEVLGAGADEEDGAAAAAFIARILARLGGRLGWASGSSAQLGQSRNGKHVCVGSLPLCNPVSLNPISGALPSRRVPDPFQLPLASFPVPSLPDIAPQAAAESTADRARAGNARPGYGAVLWCVRQPDLYGPGLLAHGLDPARIVLVTARRSDEALWAVEEALRAGPQAGLAAVVAEIERLPMVAGRRLQLAAERSGLTAFLLRRWRGAATAAAERERPSAALTRWRVTALPSVLRNPLLRNPLPPLGAEGRVRASAFGVRPPPPDPLPRWGRGGDIASTGFFGAGLGPPRWRIELLRVRGGVPGSWDVEIVDATGHVHLSAGLADRPAAPQRPHAGPAIRRAG